MSHPAPPVKESELFDGLSSSDCEDIVSKAHPRSFLCGQVMFRAGDPIEEVWLLTEGRAKLTQVRAPGTEVLLRFCVPYEVVYPPALVQLSTHTSTAVALHTCRLLVWDAANFKTTLERFPLLKRNTQIILCRRIAELQKRLCEMSTSNLPRWRV
jgi:CRP-like cAMP-binding protein